VAEDRHFPFGAQIDHGNINQLGFLLYEQCVADD